MKVYILCLLITVIVSQSPCEKVENPKGYINCAFKSSSSISEMCCFANTTMEDDGETITECLDISRVDVLLPGGLYRVQQKIEDGVYWEEYPVKGVVHKLQCFPFEDSSYLTLIMKVILAVIGIGLLIFLLHIIF